MEFANCTYAHPIYKKTDIRYSALNGAYVCKGCFDKELSQHISRPKWNDQLDIKYPHHMKQYKRDYNKCARMGCHHQDTRLYQSVVDGQQVCVKCRDVEYRHYMKK